MRARALGFSLAFACVSASVACGIGVTGERDDTATSADAGGVEASLPPEAGCVRAAPTVSAGVLAISRATSMSLDGTFADWECVPWVSLDKSSAARTDGDKPTETTVAGSFAVAYDDQYLYVAAKVIDSKVEGNNDSEPFENDSIEIYLDGDGTLTGAYQSQDHQYVIDHRAFIRDYGPEPPVDPPKAALSAITTKTSAGWDVEARIAWAELGGAASPGRLLGFDLAITSGTGSTQELMLFWWHGDGTPGGTCSGDVCCGADSEPFCDTRRFGRAELRP